MAPHLSHVALGTSLSAPDTLSFLIFLLCGLLIVNRMTSPLVPLLRTAVDGLLHLQLPLVVITITQRSQVT